jgi:putative DNA primase/helicase
MNPYGKPKLEGYDAGKWFAVESPEVDGIRALSALLTRLERDPRALAIRGELLPGVDPRRVRRTKRRVGKVEPYFAEPAGRRWMLTDFDKVPIPEHIDLVGDPVGAVEYLVGLLPDEFRDVSYHWQLSSSAGMGDLGVLSAHLWFWLDRPITEAELRRWSATIKVPVDRSLFNEVQPTTRWRRYSRPACATRCRGGRGCG